MRLLTGNIRRAEHFVAFLRRFVCFLRERMKVQVVVSEMPPSFLSSLATAVQIDAKTLRSARGSQNKGGRASISTCQAVWHVLQPSITCMMQSVEVCVSNACCLQAVACITPSHRGRSCTIVPCVPPGSIRVYWMS